MWLNVPLDEWISKVIAFADAISPIVVVAIAVYGIWQWKREARWKARYELAQTIGALAEEFQSKYNFARNPIILGLNVTTDSSEDRDTSGMDVTVAEEAERLNRVEMLRQVVLEIKKARWPASFIFSQDIEVQLDVLVDCYEGLISATRVYFSMARQEAKDAAKAGSRGRPRLAYTAMEQGQQAFAKVYGTEVDEYGQRVDEAVTKLKEYLKKSTK